MARKKIASPGKKVNNTATGKPRGKRWSELKPATQKKYRAQGVTPQKYNAWRDPRTRANAKKKGVQRWEFLGLTKPTAVSGLSRESARARAREQMRAAFGDAVYKNRTGNWAWKNGQPSYNAAQVDRYLSASDTKRLKRIATSTQADLIAWAFGTDESLDLEEPFEDAFSGLYYH